MDTNSNKECNNLEIPQASKGFPESTSSDEDESLACEVPIDYSLMTRKRRLIDTFLSGDHSHSKKPALLSKFEYGSDGQSDRSTPVENAASPNNSSIGKDDSTFQPIDGLCINDGKSESGELIPRIFLPPGVDPSSQASALSMIIHAQQQRQQGDLQQQLLRLSSFASALSPPWQRSEGLPVPPPSPFFPNPPPTTNATIELARMTHESRQKYSDFRESLLQQVGTPSTSIARRHSTPTPSMQPIDPSKGKDSAYWERRLKNNEAAKRSRDARRAKEQEIAIRAQYLEQENVQLKLEIAHLRAENAQLFGQLNQLRQARI